MRTFITEIRAEPPPPRRGRALAFLFRWGTTAFALASLVLDARFAFSPGADETTFAVFLRTLLMEIEVYLAIVVVLMTVRVLVQRGEPQGRRRKPG